MENKIPTTSDLADILNEIMSNAETVVTIANNIVKTVKKSTSFDKSVLNEVNDSLTNTAKIISILTGSLSNIYSCIYESEKNIKTLSSDVTLGDPEALASFAKTGDTKDLDPDNSIFDKYLHLLSVVSSISEVSSKVDAKAIKNSVKSIKIAISSISSIYRKAVNQLVSSGFANLTEKKDIIETAKDNFDNVVGFLSDILKKIDSLIDGNNKGPKNRIKALSSIFFVYDYFLFQSFLLSLTIKKTGFKNIINSLKESYEFFLAMHKIFERTRMIVDEIVKINNSKFKFVFGIIAFKKMLNSLLKIFVFDIYRKGLVSITAGLVFADKTIIPRLQSIFKQLGPVIDEVIKLGGKFINIIYGINSVYHIFGNRLFKRSLINAFSYLTVLDIVHLEYGVIISKLLNLIFVNLRPVIASLMIVGKNYLRIRLGIRTVNRIFNGTLFSRSLVGIFRTVHIRTYKDLMLALPATVLLSVLMTSMRITFNSLIIAGKNYFKIKIGIKATRSVIKSISGLLGYINMRISPKRTARAASSILMLSAVMVPLISIFTLLGTVWFLSIGAIVTIVSISTVIVIISKTFQYVAKRNKRIKKSAETVLVIMGSLLAFAAAVAIINDLDINYKNILGFLAFFVITVTVCTLITRIAKRISIVGAIKMSIIAGSILITAKAIAMISELEFKPESIFAFCIGLVSIIGISLLLGLASPILGLAILGASFMMIIGFALIAIAGALILIAMIPTKTLDQAKENAIKVFAVCSDIIFGFVSSSVPESEKSDNKFIRLLQYIGGPIALVAEALFAMAYVIFMFVAVTIVLLLALELKALESMDLDTEKIKANIGSVFDTIAAITAAISENRKTKNESQDQSKFAKFLRSVPLIGNIMDIVDAIMEIGSVAQSLVVVGCVTLIAKNLEYLQNIIIDKPKVVKAVDTVMQTVALISQRINENKDLLKKNNIRSFKKLSKGIAGLAKSILKFNKLDESKFNTATEGFVKFIDKTNTVDTEKIKSLRDLFEQMARFSESIKGDFEKLADTLSEKLVNILENLHNMLQEIQNGSGASFMTNTVNTNTALPYNPVSPVTETNKDTKENSSEKVIPYIDNIESILNEIDMTIKSIKREGIAVE